MSYREENGQVVLTMSKKDYELLLRAMGAYTFFVLDRKKILDCMNHINEGNPNYTLYQVEKTHE